jgi:putative phosphoribosyl transferase
MGRSNQPVFRDREDAAHQLVEKLKPFILRDPLVLGIPRGGVLTGAAIASELNAELDVVLARKLRAPRQPEFAIGAISENGEMDLNEEAVRHSQASVEYVEKELKFQLEEIERRKQLIRQVRPPSKMSGRSVIVTDDGIATGTTMIAALKAVRLEEPYELIAAVPVAPPNRLDDLKRYCDTAICLLSPRDFWAVGNFYTDFTPVEDEDVLRLLRESTIRKLHCS